MWLNLVLATLPMLSLSPSSQSLHHHPCTCGTMVTIHCCVTFPTGRISFNTYHHSHHLANISFKEVWIESRTAGSARENHLTCHSENGILCFILKSMFSIISWEPIHLLDCLLDYRQKIGYYHKPQATCHMDFSWDVYVVSDDISGDKESCWC